MPAPTLIQYAETNWTATGAKNVTGVSWNAGDFIVIIGGDEAGANSVNAPTNANLVLAGGTAIGDSTHCWGNTWTATAATTQSSQTIAGTGTTPTAVIWGFAVWVFRNSGGLGVRATDITSALTVSLARGSANSMVVGGFFDFNAIDSTGYSFTPTVANDRQHQKVATNWSVYVADYGDQGGAGSTSYGIAGVAGTLLSKIALEVKGLPAVAGVGAAQPGQTWKRHFHHPQQSQPQTGAVDTGLGPGQRTMLGTRRQAADSTRATYT